MDDFGFTSRLRELITDKSDRSFALRIGISPSALRALLGGGKPTLDTLVAIASGAGVEIKWLAMGEGPKYPEGKANSAAHVVNIRVDSELLGRIVDRVSRVYREEQVRLQDVELGRIAAEQYSQIKDMADDAEEWTALLDLMTVRLRKAIRAAAVDPANVKRGA